MSCCTTSQLAEGSSAVVQINNALLLENNILSDPLDDPMKSGTYLEQAILLSNSDSKKWEVDFDTLENSGGKKLSKSVPKKMEHSEFDSLLNRALAQACNIQHLLTA